MSAFSKPKAPAPTPAAPALIPGRIVHYTLSLRDVLNIKGQRFSNPNFVGNDPSEGDVLPMLVAVVWPGSPVACNGQVILDGNDAFWVRSVVEGDQPGEWHWPKRK